MFASLNVDSLAIECVHNCQQPHLSSCHRSSHSRIKSFHNVTIREGDHHRFEATAGNETNAVSSSITGNIFLNNSPTPVIEDVPMTLTVRGQTLALEDIDIDETTITDPGQLEIISIIDGQSIYGTFPRA